MQPDQKKAIVAALQCGGHVVAMTGDGVNDVPALKQADLGLAMGSGSQATRAVGRIVLLDSSFATVPGILDEGRRVIANIERVANLFVTKTVYAAILAVDRRNQRNSVSLLSPAPDHREHADDRGAWVLPRPVGGSATSPSRIRPARSSPLPSRPGSWLPRSRS